ncbi:Bulb-type lectin domain-containing protein [Heracleum sosnowskyi]|uniref:Bulb-type lectin domain-containing protein n=1 Tax=Heracleum sosnowskyi TaxID=360622 RepID=A0AAD8JFB9_9APIA|nr:Bulb-type lectin domain-containing protein [Heracleum sosnowskyi]
MGRSNSFILCSIFLFILPNSALAEGNGIISIGSSISAADKASSWDSPSGDFAFGFQKVQEKDQFLLSIWYAKLPEQTIVWFLNVGTTVPAGSKVQLTDDRGLVLSDTQGKELWKSEPFSGIASRGVFSDTGNFKIVGSDSSVLWDTFSNPTDTILPTQTLEVYGTLYSRRTENNFSKGRFQLRLLNDGNLVLNTREVLTNNPYDTYYSSDTSDTNPSNRGYQYYHPKVFSGTSKWTAVLKIPDNICLAILGGRGSGACGFNNVCSVDDSGTSNCACPESYSLLDENDKRGSCKPNYTQNCDHNGSSEDVYDFVEVIDTDWPLSDYEQLKPISELECKTQCLNDCFCAVAIYLDDQGSCWKKKLPLSNGKKDKSVNRKGFIKFNKA